MQKMLVSLSKHIDNDGFKVVHYDSVTDACLSYLFFIFLVNKVYALSHFHIQPYITSQDKKYHSSFKLKS